jgi:hypothetical protein
MAEPVSTSSSSSQSCGGGSGANGGMTIDIRPMIEDVSQVMTKHITSILSGVIGEYTVYKETHDTIMGLPCVRRLQERINELETRNNSCANSDNKGSIESNGVGVTREDEIHQLQSAIAELNRYIVALESKVDMKTVCSSSSSSPSRPSPAADPSHSFAEHHHEEESIRLEIHENEPVPKNNQEDSFVPCSNTKNVIVSSSLGDDEGHDDCDVADQQEEEQHEEEHHQEEENGGDENEDDKATETTEDLASLVETVKQEIEEEDSAEEAVDEAEEDAEEAEEAADEAEEDAEDAEEAADEAEEDAEDAEEAADEEEAVEEAVDEEEEAAEEEEEEPAAAEEEAEIEVSEVKIKGKTYFTTDPQNGIIYSCVDDDVGDEVGVFKNGVAVFNKGKK